MFRIDVITAAGTLPAPAAAGTPGYFTNGNLGLGVAATNVNYDWLNGIQEEIMSLLTSTSITPIKTNYTQVMQAILAAGLVSDVGTLNVLVANPAVPLTALAVGTQLTLIPLNTNTGTATLNVSSLGAIAILRPDGTNVQPGDLPAGRRIRIIYDGAAWRLINFPTRTRLGANLTLFCNPQTGNDNNNGLTLGTAFGSLQGVWNYLYLNVDVTGYVVTVQCSGNFTAGLLAQTVIVGATNNSIIFNFAASSTVNVTNSSAFQASGPGVGYTVMGPVTISASGGSANGAITINSNGSSVGIGYGILATQGAYIAYNGVIFGACGNPHISAQFGSQINALGSYSISGSAPWHALAASAVINIVNLTITLNGTPAFTGGTNSAFVMSEYSGGHITISGNTYTGSATGQRYYAQINASIQTGTNLTGIPGSSIGNTANGGVAV